jgi:cytochrome c551/c552
VPEEPVVGGQEGPAEDPVTSKSYSFALLISSFLLILSLAWALYDELFALRPWLGHQTRFAAAYGKYVTAEIPKQREAEQRVRDSAEYKALEEKLKAAAAAAESNVRRIDEESNFVDRRLAALTDPYQTARAKVTALAYQWEIAGSESSKRSRQKDVNDARKEPCSGILGSAPCSVRLPARDGKWETKQMSYDEMEAEFNALKTAKANLVLERAAAMAPVDEARKERDAYFQEKLGGFTAQQLETLQNTARRLDVKIRQINNEKAGLVDRCQSCHIAMDFSLVPPGLNLTKASLGMDGAKDSPFTPHPNVELLRVHDPGRDPAQAIERLGCSPCHGGNGRATSSERKGHGRHKYWLWPLFYRENFEAGCQQCHNSEIVTPMAPVLNRGRELYRERGCIGCHRYEGFDNEGELLLSTRQQVRQLEQQRKDLELEVAQLDKKLADPDLSDADAIRTKQRIENIPVLQSAIDARIEQLERRSASLMREEKKVGPSLKEVRMKLRKEWIPYWLENTHTFRPETKMPQFRFGLVLGPERTQEEIQAVAAFIWQSGVSGPPLAKQAPGNAARGDELFESRGCLACHSMGESNKRYGGDFAANLSRVGEKATYDYLVRWILNPRQRTRPYCPYEKRDLGPEDYAKHGLPFIFDLEHSKCPNDGHELQVQQPTVMPNLRLTVEEARDIATYIVGQKHANAAYAPANYMDDPALAKKGAELVRFYGCAGCHEIASMELEGRIGTELTTEGSKPIERLDFALYTEKAKRGILPDGTQNVRDGKEGVSWYDVKGFVEHKLARPEVYDDGKFVKQLKMPKPNVTPADITALATFLIGSADPQLPRDFIYRPADQRRDIQEGWWIITKYNCMGCHQITVGQQTTLQTLPQYAAENKDKLPPPLLSAGARVNPDWLARFLENPALSKTDTNRNGVRTYLQVRMPTFSFSENEIRKLVRFFEAMSAQAQPYLPPKIAPLTEQERMLARQLFTHPAAPCLKCHATGDPGHDRNASAPNFVMAPERLRPAWTERWITDPARLAPGTAMPSGLFRREGNRWVFSGPLPPSARAYTGDHANLLVRYMLQLTPQEQRSLTGRSSWAGAGSGGGGRK